MTFSPDASITRQDMAVMLYSYTQRFQVHLQQQPVKPFTDAGSIAAYAQIAVQTLQRAGVIRYSRGHIAVLDRRRLEQGSCECYAVARKEHQRLLAQPLAA